MRQFYIADAFTTQVFGGNPAGVVLLKEGDAFPDDETMRKTAAELRYSETAFIRPLGKAELAEALEGMEADGGGTSAAGHSEAGGADVAGRNASDGGGSVLAASSSVGPGGNPHASGRPAASDIDGGFQIRYFTPAAEVDLCGHATIASFYCLKDAGLCETGGTYLNRTLSGDLFIDVAGEQILTDMATPQHLGDIRKPEDLQELYTVMGIDYCELELVPQLISTGLPDIMLPVPSREVLDAIAPDFPALTELSRSYNVVGVHAFALGREGEKVTAYCRNFAPLYDIDEEAATGTANGALTYYLIRNGLVKSDHCTFLQGEAMDRPSQIVSRIRRDENGLQIRVGGSAAILAKGRIDI